MNTSPGSILFTRELFCIAFASATLCVFHVYVGLFARQYVTMGFRLPLIFLAIVTCFSIITLGTLFSTMIELVALLSILAEICAGVTGVILIVLCPYGSTCDISMPWWILDLLLNLIGAGVAFYAYSSARQIFSDASDREEISMAFENAKDQREMLLQKGDERAQLYVEELFYSPEEEESDDGGDGDAATAASQTLKEE